VMVLVGLLEIGQGFLSTVLGGAQYHESRWPYFLDWGSQVLFHQGSGILFGVAVSFE